MALFSTTLETGFRGIFGPNRSKLKKEVADELKAGHDEYARKSLNLSPDQPIPESYTESLTVKIRWWPRDPQGKFLDLKDKDGKVMYSGKTTPNGLPWGENLHDIFWVRSKPGVNYMAHHSGSQLAAWCKANGELKAAENEIEWVDDIEGHPEVVSNCDVRQLIKDGENISVGGGFFWMETPEYEPDSELESQRVPFSGPIPKLIDKLPLHLLPETLVVHDPHNVLMVDGNDHRGGTPKDDSSSDNDFIQRPDDTDPSLWKTRTHSYKLSLNAEATAKIEEQRKEAKDAYDLAVKDCEGSYDRIEGRHAKPGPVPAAILIPAVPPCPPLLSVPEAHLYITPSRCIGKGHHSYVFDVEWTLPREVFIPHERCDACLIRDALALVQKGGGPLAAVWKQFLNSGTKENPTTIEITEARHRPEKNVDPPSTVPRDPNQPASSTAESTHDGSQYMGSITERSGSIDSKNLQSVINEAKVGSGGCLPIPESDIKTGDILHESIYTGPAFFFPVKAKFHYPGSPDGVCCSHIPAESRHEFNHPSVTTLSVTAKLSIENDSHLAREANNYQNFPDHFFEHWNGFNIIRPLKTPQPIPPLVPQFYGYYVPESSQEKAYCSPILLLEGCGKPADPDTLKRAQKELYASLLLRFLAAGWVHGSPFARNVLRQPGPLSKFPIMREGLFESDANDPSPSFRLIDFGRSIQREEALVIEKENLRSKEEYETAKRDEISFVRKLLGPEY